jgi:anti-sigma factor RsiW
MAIDKVSFPLSERAQRERERREDERRFTASLAGLAAALLLGVIGLYVMEGLAATSKLEDCLLQGRLNCERIDTPSVEEGE